MLKQILSLLLLGIFLAACNQQKARDEAALQKLDDYLQNSPEKITELSDRISSEAAGIAALKIHSFLEEKLKADFQAEWDSLTLVLGDNEMRFKYKKFGEKPAQGWSFYISMHGGGNTRPEFNDRQWDNQIELYRPKEGIYLAPRAPTNTWNLWHEPHIDQFFTRLIELMDAYEDINTNRVYLTGYSAGGDGTFQLAPRMADQLAAAAMMAGHPNDASPLGLRNLPFALHMGALDSAYNRNKIAAEWGKKLDDLQTADPKGYIHDVQIHAGEGHWMHQKDTAAIDWMAQFNRNAYPEKIVWKQSGVTRNRFYWLAVPEDSAEKDDEVVASISNHIITIEKATGIDELIIRLNDTFADLNKPVVVKYGNTELYRGKPARNIAEIWQSLNERNDPEQYFSAEIKVSLE